MPPSTLMATRGDIKSADGGARNTSRLTPSDQGSVRNRVALLVNREKSSLAAASAGVAQRNI